MKVGSIAFLSQSSRGNPPHNHPARNAGEEDEMEEIKINGKTEGEMVSHAFKAIELAVHYDEMKADIKAAFADVAHWMRRHQSERDTIVRMQETIREIRAANAQALRKKDWDIGRLKNDLATTRGALMSYPDGHVATEPEERICLQCGHYCVAYSTPSCDRHLNPIHGVPIKCKIARALNVPHGMSRLADCGPKGRFWTPKGGAR